MLAIHRASIRFLFPSCECTQGSSHRAARFRRPRPSSVRRLIAELVPGAKMVHWMTWVQVPRHLVRELGALALLNGADEEAGSARGWERQQSLPVVPQVSQRRSPPTPTRFTGVECSIGLDLMSRTEQRKKPKCIHHLGFGLAEAVTAQSTVSAPRIHS